MALGTPQNDPDYLTQGDKKTVSIRFIEYAAEPGSGGTGVGNTINIANGATTPTLPIWSNGDYIEIRGAAVANNNGLYRVIGIPIAAAGKGTGANSSAHTAQIMKVSGAVGSADIATGPQGTSSNTVTLFGNNSVLITTDPTDILLSGTKKSVHFDTYAKKIWLIRNGENTGSADLTEDGVTLQTLYSFAKEEWKSDNDLIRFDFPFTAITPEQFEIIRGWRFWDYTVANSSQSYSESTSEAGGNGRLTRNLVRTGGWSEQYTQANTFTAEQYAGIITLGTFNDGDVDRAYFQQGTDPTDILAADDFVYTGPVNQAVAIFKDVTSNTDGTQFDITSQNVVTRNAGGWRAEGYNVGNKIVVTGKNSQSYSETGGVRNAHIITAISDDDFALTVAGTPFTNSPVGGDQNWTSAYDNTNALTLFLRGTTGGGLSKDFVTSDIAAIGVTTLQNQVYRFPLSNALDAKITETDTEISTNSAALANTSDVLINYFETAFQREVGNPSVTGTDGQLEKFGIVIDIGTISGVDLDHVSSTTARSPAGIRNIGGNPAAGPEVGQVDLAAYNSGKLTVHSGTSNTNATGFGKSYNLASSGALTRGGAGILITLDGTVDGTFPTSGWTDASFTLQRGTPLATANSTLESLYNVVQYKLKQDNDINFANVSIGTTSIVTGSTADELLAFSGDVLTTGSTTSPPENPSGGGTGVIIEGFDGGDRNDVRAINNGGIETQFPFLAQTTLNFNTNLTTDADAVFSLFYEYTYRRTVTLAGGGIAPTSNRQATIQVASGVGGVAPTDFSVAGTGTGDNQSTSTQLSAGDYIRISGASNVQNNGIYRIITYTDAQNITVVKVDGDAPTAETTGTLTVDEDPIDTPDAIPVLTNDGVSLINIAVSGATYAVPYDYSNNNQGSRIKAGTATELVVNRLPAVIARAIGFATGQFVEVTGTIGRDTTTTITVTSGLERNYSNPT